MDDRELVVDGSNGISRRVFLKASALAGGGAAAFLGGLQPLRLREVQEAEGTAAMGLSGLSPAGPVAVPDLATRLAAQGSAKVYYVDGIYGDDKFNGSLPQRDGDSNNGPFKTIMRGVEELGGGDLLMVREGVYYEQVIVESSKSGSAEQLTTIAAFPGERPVIDGRAGVDGPNCGLPRGGPECDDGLNKISRYGTGYREAGLVHIKADYLLLEGFVITRSMGRGLLISKDRSGANADGPRGRTRDVVIRNCEISYSRHVGLLLESCGDVTDTEFAAGVPGCTIEGCDVSRSGNFAPYERSSGELDWPGGLVLKESKNITIHKTRVHENWGEGIMGDPQDHGTRSVSITECECYDNKQTCLYLHGVNQVRVERNLFYQSDDSEFSTPAGITIRPTEPGHDKWTIKDATEITIINNIIIGFKANIKFNANADKPGKIADVHLWFNTLVEGEEHAFFIEKAGTFERCEIRNNVVYQRGGSVIDGPFEKKSWTFSHNAWFPNQPEKGSIADGEGDVVENTELEFPNAPRSRGCVDPRWYGVDFFSSVIGAAKPILAKEYSDSGLFWDAQVWPDVDYFCRPRDINQPDIGAHEYAVDIFSEARWSEWEPLHETPYYFEELAAGRNKIYVSNYEWKDGAWSRSYSTKEGYLALFAPGGIALAWHSCQREPGHWNKQWAHLFDLNPFGYSVFKELVVARNKNENAELDGLLQVFAIASDGFVYRAYQVAAPIPPDPNPPANANQPGKPQKTRYSEAWSGWEAFNGYAQRFVSLSVAENEDGRLEIFGVQPDDSVWHTYQKSGGDWKGEWLPMHSKDNEYVRLAASRNEDGRLELFGIKRDGSMWHTWQKLPNRGWNNDGWQPMHSAAEKPRLSWQSLSAGLNSGGKLELFAVDSDNEPWHTWQRQNGWSEWSRFFAKEQQFRNLIASEDLDGVVNNVFGLAVDGSAWRTEREGASGWTPWQRLHGRCDRFEKLIAIANMDNYQEVFGLKTDGSMWHVWEIA